MAQQTIAELLNSFAEYIGTKDKEIIELINQKITQLKSDETMPEKLIQKITEFKSSLDGVIEKMTALEKLDLKVAYEKGKLGQ